MVIGQYEVKHLQGIFNSQCWVLKIASRIVNSHQPEILIVSIMTEPEQFHNLNSIIPKWKQDGENLYKELLRKIISRLWEKLTTGCVVHESCQAQFKLDFTHRKSFILKKIFAKLIYRYYIQNCGMKV